MKVRKITPLLAASMMGKTPSFVYIGMQRGKLPIGTAVKKEEGRGTKYSYYISPKLFMAYTGFSEQDIIEAAEEKGFCCV
jgi:hypothetical protein